MGLGIGVEREPFPHKRKPIRKVECPKAGTRIAGRKLAHSWGGDTEEAPQKCVQRDGLVVLASPYYCALKAELQVLGGLEADLLHMHPGVVGKDMALQRADQELIAEWAGQVGQHRNVERLNAVNSERINILSIVGVGHARSQAGSQPVVLFAEGDLVIEVMG